MVEMTTTKAAEALENMARTIDMTANAMCVNGHTATAEDMAAQADALRLGAAALRDSDWLDIAVAPKDKYVDIWVDGRRVPDACQKPTALGAPTWLWWAHGCLVRGEPTHYRPLPSPPKEQK